MGLRPIQPMPLPDGMVPAKVDGARPELRWVKPTDLFVDATYQRDLSRNSWALIRRMIEKFAWNRMKPPIVTPSDGKLHVIDGQHTAIAAASIGIKEIPVFVVNAVGLDERARSFVGHNTDRITVTPINIYKALLASGDCDAQDIANVCQRAGVRIRQLNQAITPAEGDTMAIGTIRKLVKARGVIGARKVLECLVKARRAPISAEEIRAAEWLICEEEVSEEALTFVIRIDGDQGLSLARAAASRDRMVLWRTVADRWQSKLPRRAA